MALISSNAYLTVAQMKDNAQYILDYLTARGWSVNAVCGMLGNMQSESTINPGIWQNLDSSRKDLGYGLVQWTPSTKYTSWATENGYSIGNITGQLQRIIYEKNNGIQWQKRTTTMSFAEFSVSGKSVEELAELFELNYEQHAGDVQLARKTQARYWYDNLVKDDSADVIEKAITFALSIANDDSHGYDQGNRWGPDYDCSSLMVQSWENAGVPVKTNGASYTGNMRPVFLKCGFNDVITQVDVATGSGLKRGDVLLHEGHHTGMYLGDGTLIHASINENGTVLGGQSGDQTGKEICTRSYYNHPWDHVLRYKSGGGNAANPPVPNKVSVMRWIPA